MPAVLSSNMAAGRRVPLSALPNANNNTLPLSGSGANGNNHSGIKRTRSHTGEQRELQYSKSSQNSQPPAKRLMIDGDRGAASSRMLPVRKANAIPRPPNSFQKKLEALQVTKQTHSQRVTSTAADRAQKPTDESLESIRLWQRHYKKAFPQFVFYFENIPEEQRGRVSRQILSLGAREEKFFSKAITHIITIRPIPQELGTTSLFRGQQTNASQDQDASTSSKTIDPSLLNQNAENKDTGQEQKEKHVAEVSKKTRAGAFSNGDILLKAREMGMKIWALEKIERMMHTMFHTETGEQPSLLPKSCVYVERNGMKVDPEANLSQMIRRERTHGHADRDYNLAMQDRVHFRGYYIYVHDISEKLRPIMIRDYPKVAAKEDGKWPQFRLSGPGKCPFVEDPNHLRRLEREEKIREKEEKERKLTKDVITDEERRYLRNGGDRALRDVSHNLRSKHINESRTVKTEQKDTKDGAAPIKEEEQEDDPANKARIEQVPLFGSAQANVRQMPRFAGGEPVASGVQPSNITSAIRSQMISSTAAAPGGGRVPATKEVNQLKRRILERNSSSTTAHNLPLAYLTDIRAALNSEKMGPATRAAKRKGLDKVIEIHDDNEEEKAAAKATVMSKHQIAAVTTKQNGEHERARAEKKTREKEKEIELKPGYCENCREKFEDFDRHVIGRKHRKFALTRENWFELDDLLKHLVRH